MTKARDPQANVHDVIILGAGAAGLMCAALPASADVGAAARAIQATGREDPHLRRRALQFYQSAHESGEFPLGQSAVLPFGAERLHPARLHRAGRANTASPSTKRPAGNCSATARRGRSSTCCWPNAARPMRSCGCACASPRFQRAKMALSSCRIRASFAARSLVVATGGPPFPRWDRAGSATKLPSSSA